MQTKALVSLAEAARALGVSERTVRRLVTARRVPAYKVFQSLTGRLKTASVAP